ncbi:MAG: DUF3486 family protein, partial [Deltaproteobacteria bacterium]|nr:DUF3486 family protein [Deltaproteobacteria bacterium]
GGKSSVGRYGREFSARLTRMREVNEKAKAILEQANGEPLRMEEATAQIGLSMVAEALLKLDDLEGVDPEKLLLAVARLQNSGATRERMRIVWRQEQQAKAKAAAEEVKGIAKKGGLSDELVREIEERVLGIAA